MEICDKLKLDKVCFDIMDLIVDNLEYLLKTPKALAFTLWKWDVLLHMGRTIEYTSDEYDKSNPYSVYAGACDDNPKYVLEHLLNKIKGKKNKEYIHDAWGVSVSNGAYSHDRLVEFMNEDLIIEIETPIYDFNYWTERLKHIFKTEYKVRDYLFCTIGNGLTISNGFICEKTVHGESSLKFLNHKKFRNSLEPEYRKKLEEIINRDECVKVVNDCIKDSRKESLPGMFSLVQKLVIKAIDEESASKDMLDHSFMKIDFENIIFGTIEHANALNDFSKTIPKVDNEECLLGALPIFIKAAMHSLPVDIQIELMKNSKIEDSEEDDEEVVDKVYHYPVSFNHSILFRHTELDPSFKEHIIKTAREIYHEGVDERYYHEDATKVKRKMVNILKFYGEKP